MTGNCKTNSVSFPASSVTVTVVVTANLAVVGVPVITPVTSASSSPAGSVSTPYDSISLLGSTGRIRVMVSSTFIDDGTTYSATGAVRSIVTVRMRSADDV